VSRPEPSPLAAHWTLDPGVTFLNHGAFGACPREVLALQSELRARMERDPIDFLTRAVEPLLDEELFVMLPKHSGLVPARRASLTIAEAAALPLILPTGTHGLRRRIAAEFEQRGLVAQVVAEIDSLSLLMTCVYDGMAATIKPMAAINLEGSRGRQWRALSISDARMSRRNYLYSLPPQRLSAAAGAVASEIRQTALELIESGAWTGVEAVRAAAAA